MSTISAPQIAPAISSPRTTSTSMSIVPGHPLHRVQRFAGNSAVSGLIQRKLRIGAPDSPEEREADRVAAEVMRMPDGAGPVAIGSYSPVLHRKCAACSEEEEQIHRSATGEGPGTAPPIVNEVLQSSGHSIDPVTREFMEARFGQDFSGVRVHSDAKAAKSAADVDAQAYTVGQNVVFGAARYAPRTTEGQELLAHELSHVVQQMDNQSRKPGPLMRRPSGQAKQAAPATFFQQLYVVRDSSIGAGGGKLVTDLAVLKSDVMKLRNTGTWTLVLAIHGSLDRIAAQAPPDWQRNAVFYEATDINILFNGDSAWVQWRDTYGPSHLVLTSCQVSAKLEGTMINNFTRHVSRPGSSTTAPIQSAVGLGTHCKPVTYSMAFEFPVGTAITTRKQYQRLSGSAKGDMEIALSDLNSKYGYYGASPVANSHILDYYFDVDPRGSWTIVTVGIDQGDTISDTDIPFWNRTTGPRAAEFLRFCDQGIGIIRPQTPRSP
jgi:hypothetical protein